jgi:hypothetical protein
MTSMRRRLPKSRERGSGHPSSDVGSHVQTYLQTSDLTDTSTVDGGETRHTVRRVEATGGSSQRFAH